MQSNRDQGLQGLKLAHVTSVPFFLVTQLKGQLQFLSEAGVRVTAVTSPGIELAQMSWTDALVHEPVEIFRKPSPLRDLLALVRLIRLFRSRQFAIVHSTTPKAGLLTALAGWAARTPIRVHTFTGQAWATMSGPLRWISRMADRVIGRLSTRCYADSQSQRAFLVEQGIVSPDRIGVIGSGSLAGVDISRFDRKRFTPEDCTRLRSLLGIPSGAAVLLFIGRITRDKGIAELLGAFSALRIAGIAVDLVLVGPLEIGNSQEDRDLEQQVRAAAGVHTVGYSDRPEQYLAIADILCLPSYREGFGTVVIEAAAMGLPTVGTRITGLIDAIVDGETGLLVPPRDAVSLERALRCLLEDQGLSARLGHAARERCLRDFDSKVVSQRLAGEYMRLLRQAGKAGPHV